MRTTMLLKTSRSMTAHRASQALMAKAARVEMVLKMARRIEVQMCAAACTGTDSCLRYSDWTGPLRSTYTVEGTQPGCGQHRQCGWQRCHTEQRARATASYCNDA